VHNTFIAWGADFRKHGRIEAPVSLADVQPTILKILGIGRGAADKNHGRILEEVLQGRSNASATHRSIKTSAGSYEASLDISTFEGHDYVDGGSRKR